MKKDMPNIYKGSAPKDKNQKSAFITKSDKEDIIHINKDDNDIKKQIKNIFDSDRFLYKADTLITMSSGDKIKKTIIGKTNNSLITIDDELIDVSKISKIELL